MSNYHDPLKDIDPEEFIRQRKERYETAQQEFVRVFSAKGDIVAGEMLTTDNETVKPYIKVDVDASLKALERLSGYLDNLQPRDTYELESGEILFNVHKPEKCAGRPCAIHGASEHPLAEKPRSWKHGQIYRTCEHGVEHPDFDSLAYLLDRQGWLFAQHRCCEGKCCGIPEVVDI